MNHRQTVQIALLCLEGLDQLASKSVTPQELSHQQGLPLLECMATLFRLTQAEIVDQCEDGSFRLHRPLGELSAMEILDAVWASETKQPVFRMLVGGNRGGILQKTLELVHDAKAREKDTYING